MIKRLSRLIALKKQIQRIENRLQKMEKLSRRFSLARLLIFLGSVILCVLATYTFSETVGWITAAIGVLSFNIVAYYHRRLDSSAARHRIWLGIRSTQLARLQINWPAIPQPFLPSVNGDHPFENDFDLTGNKSLHHLIDIAISREGSQRLKDWLLTISPDVEKIHWRQKLVRELAPMSRFRDKFRLNFAAVARGPLQGEKFLNWLQQRDQRSPQWLLPVFTILAALNIILLLLNSFGAIPKYFLITFFIYAGLYLMNATRIDSIFDEAIFLEDELKKLGAILLYLENYPYGEKQNLAQLCYPLYAAKKRPSAQMRKTRLIATAIGMRMNQIVRIILNAFVPWDFYCAHFLDKQKSRLAESLPNWLDICFELEALNSLANFVYLNPEYTFPKISRVDEISSSCFQIKKIGASPHSRRTARAQ